MWPRRLRVAHDEEPFRTTRIRRIRHGDVVPLLSSAINVRHGNAAADRQLKVLFSGQARSGDWS
jgi:hypothetical protein